MLRFLKEIFYNYYFPSLLLFVFTVTFNYGQSCPVINFIGDDFAWNSNKYGNGIHTLTDTDNGFLVMGRNNTNDDFQSSNDGQNLTIKTQGAYLVKYSSDSNLQWSVSIKYADGTQPGEIDPIESAVEDLDGNIYLTSFSKGDFYDTAETKVSLFNPSYVSNYQ